MEAFKYKIHVRKSLHDSYNLIVQKTSGGLKNFVFDFVGIQAKV